jgi:SAM-dependent methyltransferase
MSDGSRDAWQKLYARHGLQYGGRGDTRALEPHLGPGMLALDAGCGDGKTTDLLSRKCEVVGCDFSREALVSMRSQRQAADSLNLVECNLMSLPFEREKFDAVTCIHALSHMVANDRSRAARELSRVLRPGGHVLVEVFGRQDMRFGEGEEVEAATFLRGNGILTHYFGEREIGVMFPGLRILSEISQVRRVSLGTVAGKRETIRTLMESPNRA